jgi:hypothetical protein
MNPQRTKMVPHWSLTLDHGPRRSSDCFRDAALRSHKRDPAFAHKHPVARPIGVALVPRHYRLEPPYCAASLVARAIDYTAARFFVRR